MVRRTQKLYKVWNNRLPRYSFVKACMRSTEEVGENKVSKEQKEPRLWLVRSGRRGERELDALEQGKAFIGWSEVGNLSNLDRSEIVKRLEEIFPGSSKNRIASFASQLDRFVNIIQIGDLVVMPRKLTDGIAIGEVTGDYNYIDDPDDLFPHSRSVKWHEESVPRDNFKQDLRYSFGAQMTICGIRRDNAVHRVLAVLKTGKDPGPLLDGPGRLAPIHLVDDEPDIDIQDLANQQIVSLIKSEFAGHALADLVAEILETKGYTTKVSPPGPDRGVDILAAGGTLGLGEDRICVQVKSSDGEANRDVVLKLIGSVSQSGAQTGLLVSIGGVNKAARKDLDDDFFKLRLWQMDDLLKALFKNYAELPEYIRAKLPLRQIWAPVSQDDL